MPSAPGRVPQLTREGRRALTVAELLVTARAAFLSNGYAATSLDAIAESAGYSKGAVYSNFRDKPTLCRAVLQDIHREKMRELADLADRILAADDDGEGAGESPRGRLAGFVDGVADWLRTSLGDVEWTMLEFEFAALSRRDPQMRASLVEMRREAAAAVVQILEGLLGDAAPLLADAAAASRDDGPRVPTIGEIADLILSTGIGLSIQRAVDPEVSVEPAIGVLRAALAIVESAD